MIDQNEGGGAEGCFGDSVIKDEVGERGRVEVMRWGVKL